MNNKIDPKDIKTVFDFFKMKSGKGISHATVLVHKRIYGCIVVERTFISYN